MTKITDFGYTTKEIKCRSMRLGELILTITAEMFKSNNDDKECRFVWLDTAEVTRIDGVKGLYIYPFNISARVRVYGFALVCESNGNEFYKVILEDTGLE